MIEARESKVLNIRFIVESLSEKVESNLGCVEQSSQLGRLASYRQTPCHPAINFEASRGAWHQSASGQGSGG